MKRDYLELKQKLMQRFLDNAIDKETYDTMLTEIDRMIVEDQELNSRIDFSPSSLPVSQEHFHHLSGSHPQVQVIPIPYPYPPQSVATFPPAAPPSFPEPVVMPEEEPSPEIDEAVLKSLQPGQSLEIWWHHALTEECAAAWRRANVPIKLSLNLNGSIDDASLKVLGNVPHLREINLTSTAISDDGLRHLAPLSELESLILISTRVRGTSFQYLENLRSLRELTLTSSEFGDEGMERIGTMTSLEELRLDDTAITDQGMPYLEKLHELKLLNLQGSLISDQGLEAIAGLDQLLELYLGGTIPYDGLVYESPISDAGLNLLQDLTELRILHLNDTQISDTGIPFLKKMKKLRELNLADTYITDASLPALRRLECLREVIVDGTEITISGIRKIFGRGKEEYFHGGRVGAWSRLGRFLASPWSRKN
ncbi:MAG: hypothetical protein Q4D62_03480 [Planctomycetia bacterium]|nr:hypothetical protein [Planctomycetia bacterium]